MTIRKYDRILEASIDEKDRRIMNLLQQNGRMTLKEIGKKVGLSIDSVNKRVKKLLEANRMHIGAFINPKALGYDLVAGVSIKISNAGDEQYKEFIDYLVKSPHTIEVITTLGEFDVICVFIAKDTEDLDTIYRHIRSQFKDIIAGWESSINLKVHKFEEYSL